MNSPTQIQVKRDKLGARDAIERINATIVNIEDERSMPGHWQDIADYAYVLHSRANSIARLDR